MLSRHLGWSQIIILMFYQVYADMPIQMLPARMSLRFLFNISEVANWTVIEVTISTRDAVAPLKEKSRGERS